MLVVQRRIRAALITPEPTPNFRVEKTIHAEEIEAHALPTFERYWLMRQTA